jgi:pimeloyl-ACP methyl ester carboxylesterase
MRHERFTTAGGLSGEWTDLRPPWRTSGTALVLHHGIGTDRGIWSQWVPRLAVDRPVLRFDMRGFGQSAIPDRAHDWTLQAMVSDVWEVADAFGSQAVHLMGESVGGTIVLAAALERPDRVASVSMSNASFRGRGIGRIDRWAGQFTESGVQGWSEQMMIDRFAPGAGEPDALAWFAQTQARTPAHVALGLSRLLAGCDLGSRLAGFDRPARLVLPESSPFVPLEDGVELKRLVPALELRVVPGVRHGLAFSHALTEAAGLGEYLKRIDAGA